MSPDAAYWGSALRRRLPTLFAAALVVTALALALAVIWPPAYRAQAVLLVDPPRVGAPGQALPETRTRAHIYAMAHRMMTRSSLLETSSRLGLHDNRILAPEQILHDMRQRISLHIEGGGEFATTVTLEYEAPNPRIAAAAANALADFLLAESALAQSPAEVRTASVLQREATRLDAELERQAARLSEFRSANLGSLPDTLPDLRDRHADLQRALNALPSDDAGGAEVNVADLERTRLEAALAATRSAIAHAEDTARRLERLERDYAAARARYETALSRAASLRTLAPGADALPGLTLALLEPAEPPSVPARPRRGLIVSTGLALGLLVGLGAALSAELLDPTVRRAVDVTRHLGHAPFATIPLFGGQDDAAQQRQARRRAAVALALTGMLGAGLMAVHILAWPLGAVASHLIDRLGLGPLIGLLRQAILG